jgi:hypothetical protein
MTLFIAIERAAPECRRVQVLRLGGRRSQNTFRCHIGNLKVAQLLLPRSDVVAVVLVAFCSAAVILEPVGFAMSALICSMVIVNSCCLFV